MTNKNLTVIKNADLIISMDDVRRVLNNYDILISDGQIQKVEKNIRLNGLEKVIDAAGCLVTPGLVNTHHHLFQSLTKAVPGGQNALLFGWLKTLYPIWSRFGPEEIRISTILGLSELALSGCTMSSDHLYLFPNGATLDDTIFAAQEVGLRFYPTRGSMSIGESLGGLPPDSLVEKEQDIINDCIRLIDKFNDTSPASMIRIGLAPCSPFSVTRELMRDTAVLARDKKVTLHTHLAENEEDIAYSLEKFGCRPGQYAEELGWTGKDVWHAHCVKLDKQEINLFSRSRTGVSHCPCSNCRLGSGIAPINEMLTSGVNVGLGVDGSASNDSGSLISEARQAMLLQRVSNGADAMSAMDALELATRGGADILGRPECGRIQVGARGDLAIWDISGIDSAGSWDPAALLLAGPKKVKHLVVEGRIIVCDGNIVTVKMSEVLSETKRLVQNLQL
ncbi:MAG: 8-oxoguanine deaminase [Rhodobacterales bacterium]|jgi:cytosine/adenosine deaminase-related metal-dependent hydrolase|nr:8-oxoguanine deaminase [Rhodobacterales bacterium]